MPVYVYVCDKCRTEQDHLRPMRDRDTPMPCEPEGYACDGTLHRKGMELPTVGKSSYSPGVILGSGQKLAGSFKTARKKKGWHRP